MSDITMCLDKQCPSREDCHRFTAEPRETYQSYAHYQHDHTDKCFAFWEKEDE